LNGFVGAVVGGFEFAVRLVMGVAAMVKAAVGEVGIVLTEKPDDVESWEIMLDAIRHEPDPARLDRFLADLPGDNMKKQLSKWKE
jgi:hypothetical protein